MSHRHTGVSSLYLRNDPNYCCVLGPDIFVPQLLAYAVWAELAMIAGAAIAAEIIIRRRWSVERAVPFDETTACCSPVTCCLSCLDFIEEFPSSMLVEHQSDCAPKSATGLSLAGYRLTANLRSNTRNLLHRIHFCQTFPDCAIELSAHAKPPR